MNSHLRVELTLEKLTLFTLGHLLARPLFNKDYKDKQKDSNCSENIYTKDVTMTTRTAIDRRNWPKSDNMNPTQNS